MALPEDFSETDHLVYHYTKASTALDHILPDMRIRLGPIHDTNDPSEGRGPSVGVAPDGWLPRNPNAVRDAFDAIANALRRARVACFCRDMPDAEPVRAAMFAHSSRGWARDRMWAQYADNHSGVCLCFHRENLLRSFRAELADDGPLLADAVTYTDAYSTDHPRVDLAESLGPERYALTLRDGYAHIRYFTKRRDWAGEQEWRMVLLNDRRPSEYAFVSIASSLSAIVVGHRFTEGYRSQIENVCRGLRIPAYRMLYSGNVSLVPYVDGPPPRP
jgi:hypothetical protein